MTLKNYRAVTNGQSLGDAAIIPFDWTGVSLRSHKPTSLNAIHDTSSDWYVSAVGHPRETERPESYIARLRRASTGALLRDIPITPGVRLAAILGHIIHPPIGEGLLWGTDTYATIDRNNVIGDAAHITQAYVTQPFSVGSEINARVTVTPAPAPYLTGIIRLTFGPSDFTNPGAASVGAVLSTKDDNSTTLTRIQVFNWSTSEQATFDLPTVSGVVFVRIVWSGTELRWQFSGSPINPAAAPNVILKDIAPTDPTFLRMTLQNGGPDGASASKVENITIGGLSTPQTIYSLAQQENDNGGVGISTGDLSVEMWQVAPLLPDRKGLSVTGVF